MKVTLLAAGLVATVFAQDLSTIPECARTCLTDAIAQDGQCQATDSACVCGRIDALTSLATSCVLSACGQDVALNQVLPAVQTFCANVGSGSSAASSAPASTSAAPTSASESSSSAAASSSASAASSSSESSASSTGSSMGSATGSAAHSTMTHSSSATGGSSATATDASATSSVVTAGAAQYGSVGGLAAFVLGAVAIF